MSTVTEKSTAPVDDVEKKPVTVSGWKKNATHPVVCPSGSAIAIRVIDLPRMIEVGTIPQDLLHAALGRGEDDVPKTAEEGVKAMKDEREFTDLVTLASVVEPKISEADLEDIPYEDKQFIAAIATRRREFDAVGDHIGGLHKSEKFRRFRGIGEFDEIVEGL